MLTVLYYIKELRKKLLFSFPKTRHGILVGADSVPNFVQNSDVQIGSESEPIWSLFGADSVPNVVRPKFVRIGADWSLISVLI